MELAAARGEPQHRFAAAAAAVGKFEVVERAFSISSRLYEGRARPASATRSAATALKPTLSSAAAFALAATCLAA